jgi:hypothetical protein
MSRQRRLTDAAIQKLRPPQTGQVDHYDLALPAFGLRVSNKGTKSFFVMKRVDGRLRRITLGRYPALSLVEARKRAEEVSIIAQSAEIPS